jgi:benzoate-CoA ligase
MMKVKGMWVSPVEIENVLMEHPMVQEAAAIGSPDGNQLVKPAAYIVLKQEAKNTPQMLEEIRQHVLDKLAAYKCPQTFEVVAELPKTATGKIQRYKLRESASAATNTQAK